MDLESGYPYFLIRSGLQRDYEDLQQDVRTDVAILGGGISGALAAYELQKLGIACVVLDKRGIGLGSTAASTSLLQYEIDRPLHLLANQVGEGPAVSAYKLCDEAIDTLTRIASDIGFKDIHACQSLYFSSPEKGKAFLEKEFESRRSAGFDVHYLEGRDVYQRYGLRCNNAILSGRAAKTNAFLLTHYLHRHNIKKGCRVFENITITTIKHQRKGVELLAHNGHRVKARYLVYANGYEAVKLIAPGLVKLKSTYACAGVHEQSLPGFFKDMVFWNTSDPYLYMREDAGRLVVGGRDENAYDPHKRDKLLKRKTGTLKKDCEKAFPALDFRPQFGWAGTFGTTSDGLPYIGGYAGFPNSYFALGFGGNGITFSAIAAGLIAAHIKGKVDSIPSFFRFDR